MSEGHQHNVAMGRVYLVGAGPGAPDLLTLKGKRCLGQADVVIYDYLADGALLRYARPQAELVYAGKKAGTKTLTQDEIHELMVRHARMGKIVVRLKGGDPFIFGRGGEEGEHLKKHGIHFEVVPGVSSATGVPLYAGIPLTHRDYASSVAIIAGHEASDEESSIFWEHLSRGVHTIVFLMGMSGLADNMRKLIAGGCDPQRPVALIRWGTKGSQETLVGTVENIARLAKAREFKPPVVTVVGEVVNLREHLNWFETKPLFGRRIVITRPRQQARSFCEKIEDLGAEIIEFPTIEILPPQSYDALDEAIQSIGGYHWVIFTSVNGVGYFFRRYYDLGRDVRDLSGIKIATIGSETAKELYRYGLRPDLVPSEYRAEGLLSRFKSEKMDGRKVLLPRAAKARDVLPRTLTEWGARVDVVEAYRAVAGRNDPAWLRAMIEDGMVDMITFTSSSTVANFAAQFAGANLKALVAKTRVACIGPVTQKTAEELGMDVAVCPREYTVAALTESILQYFTRCEVRQAVRRAGA